MLKDVFSQAFYNPKDTFNHSVEGDLSSCDQNVNSKELNLSSSVKNTVSKIRSKVQAFLKVTTIVGGLSSCATNSSYDQQRIYEASAGLSEQEQRQQLKVEVEANQISNQSLSEFAEQSEVNNFTESEESQESVKIPRHERIVLLENQDIDVLANVSFNPNPNRKHTVRLSQKIKLRARKYGYPEELLKDINIRNELGSVEGYELIKEKNIPASRQALELFGDISELTFYQEQLTEGNKYKQKDIRKLLVNAVARIVRDPEEYQENGNDIRDHEYYYSYETMRAAWKKAFPNYEFSFQNICDLYAQIKNNNSNTFYYTDQNLIDLVSEFKQQSKNTLVAIDSYGWDIDQATADIDYSSLAQTYIKTDNNDYLAKNSTY